VTRRRWRSIPPTVNESDYPALYRSAEAASTWTKKAHLSVIGAQSILLVIAGAFGLFAGDSRGAAITSAMLFLISLGVTVYGRTQHFQRHWYQARALAESIKTTTWRYIMGAEPYDGEDAASARLYGAVLMELLVDNHSLGNYFAGDAAAGDQLTARMQEIRASTVEQKLALYRDTRIADQRRWYATKAKAHRRSGQRWFSLLVVVYLLAISTLLIKIAVPSFKFYPSSVLAVAASGILTWIEVKRYSEIGAAYALAAHEIGIINQGSMNVTSAEELSKFVADAENAFSREHTQWAARRDLP
jgi:hypothetical protein